jgi:hypothetical protein
MPCQVDAVFFADCAARGFFDQVANKWAVMILTLLTEKPTRFNKSRSERCMNGRSTICMRSNGRKRSMTRAGPGAEEAAREVGPRG